MDGKVKYVILEEGEYRNLQRFAEAKRPTVTKIDRKDLLFLASLSAQLEIYYDQIYFHLLPSSVNVIGLMDGEVMLDEIFSRDLCEKYHNRISRFISEVL